VALFPEVEAALMNKIVEESFVPWGGAQSQRTLPLFSATGAG
jgi:hypothetical protein